MNEFSNGTQTLINLFTKNTSLLYRLVQRLDATNLRHTYYLVTPNETMFATVDEVPNYNVQVKPFSDIHLY
ncbi:unnamed protein product [Anisakis simplex]|uniref:FAS1 domain-containing protein n=1 Tax=Anisakis simplex TaxID=6269 RepID=A0A0M3JFD0_ANISI|nr:unnamed protein product [Anisakis simplex]